jgi:hypothetical protein
MAPALWEFVDRIVDDHFHGERSGYFQRLVTNDMAETSGGIPYSRIVGDPSALPKAAQDKILDRMDRMERMIEAFIADAPAHKRR